MPTSARVPTAARRSTLSNASRLPIPTGRRSIALAVTLLCVGVAWASPGLMSQAQAQEQQNSAIRKFDIPGGPLNAALNRFAEEAGVFLTGAGELTQGKNTRGVSGSFSNEAALDVLLNSTGLEAVKTVQNQYVIRQTVGAQTNALPSITVAAASERSATTEGTGSYTSRITSAATGLVLSLRETPQSVTVITRQRMEDQNLQSLNEVLANTTGISSSQNDGNRMTYYSRGFTVTNFMYDGIPTSATANWYAGESELDSAIYDRVEVVRGATGLLTGAGNPSASINLVRKHADSKVFTGDASVSAGSWNNYRTSIDLTTPLDSEGRVRARVVAAYQDKDSYVNLSNVKKTLFYGVVDADLTSSTKLSMGVDFQDNDPKGTAWGGLPLWYTDGSRTNWSRSATTAPSWSYWATRTQSAFANLEHRFDNDWKLNVGYTHSKQALDTKLLYMYSYPNRATGLGVAAVASIYKGFREQDSVTAQISGPFELLGRKHELTFGVLGSEQTYRYNYQRGLNLATIVYDANWNGAYPEPQWAAETTLEQGRLTQQGVYGAGRISLSDRVNLIGGGRYSTWNDKTPTTERDNRKFIPYAGLTYDLSASATVYASYTGIFNPQDYKDRFGAYLAPVVGKSYELGLKNSWYDGKLNTSASIYQIQQDNLAQEDSGHTVPNSIDTAYYGAKGVKSQGFELEMSGEVATGWNMFAGYSHYTSLNAAGATVNTNQPRTLLRLFSTYRLPDRMNQITVGGGVNWQSSNYTIAYGPNGQESVRQGAYALVNLMARYEFDKHLSLQVNLNNLLDKAYYSQIGYYSAGAWGSPRNVLATLNYKF